MPALADRVMETSTSTGTGAMTLAGAVTGYRAFSAAGIADGAPVPYLIEAVDADGVPTGAWETGIGWLSAGTLARDTGSALASSNSNALVNFAAGTKRVSLSLNAGAAARSFIRVAPLTGVTANFTTPATIDFTDTAITRGITFADHDEGGADPDRVTIRDVGSTSGAPVQWVRAQAMVSMTGLTIGEHVRVRILLNGGAIASQTYTVDETAAMFSLLADVRSVAVGDYYQVEVEVETDTSATISEFETYFLLEAMD